LLARDPGRLFSELLSNSGGRIADLLHRALKLLAAHTEVFSPTMNLALPVHRDLTAVGCFSPAT
jgi:hypothetical protein